MAERIKYLYINSVKRGTEGQLEPNSSLSIGQSESNSNHQAIDRLHIKNRLVGDCLKSVVGFLVTLAERDENRHTLDEYSDDNPEDDNGSSERVKIISGGSGSSSGKDSSSSEKDQNDATEDSSPENSQDERAPEQDTEQSSKEVKSSLSATQESGPLPPVSSLNDPVDKEKLIESQRPSEMVDGPLRGVAYYRTSSEEKNDASARITVDQQKPLVEAAFKAFGIERVQGPIRDRAISGETFDREGLEKIEELAEAGEINVVAVSDIDRLGRICEETIGFVKRLRYEYDVYIVANVRWYDISNGDDLETFNAKAGRAEAENKKRGGRGNRGKLFKLVDNGSDSYLSWFKKIPIGCEESDEDHGIKLADDPSREIPRIALEEFMSIEAERNEYATTEEIVKERLRTEFEYEYGNELDIKAILQNPIYTGRAVLTIKEPETHSVDEAEVVIEMPDLQLFDEKQIKLWEQAQERIARLEARYRNKTETRPETLLSDFELEVVDDELAAWTLICPECGSTSDYQYQGTRTDADGTKRQKCKCTGGENDTHFFRVPTREEYEQLPTGHFEASASSSQD